MLAGIYKGLVRRFDLSNPRCLEVVGSCLVSASVRTPDVSRFQYGPVIAVRRVCYAPLAKVLKAPQLSKCQLFG